ncbi:MAG: 3-phosphoshikimate 1-carboxyvinyltransferase, partial [Candidatus Omnitrophota bacterium]|nr:3-phosphoshikimate 1-carboxyvinyltransferase [Candidatus Omnitrophota bacterium]
RMGVRFRRTKNALLIRGPFALKGGRFSLKDCPDLVPVMAVLALFARGTTRLCDIRHARVKESDRISDLRSELLKTGADVRETQTELIINPRPGYRSGVLLDPHQDHRLAMAFSVLGLKIGTKIRDIDCVRKSYPGFVRDIRALGAKVSRAKQGKILNKR